jgi:type IV secretory pathway VirB2 component (pilin)
MASGYIAGGSIAGIFIALVESRFPAKSQQILQWATANNPFFEGPRSDLLSVIPFALLCLALLAAARGWLFGKPKAAA